MSGRDGVISASHHELNLGILRAQFTGVLPVLVEAGGFPGILVTGDANT